MQPHILLLCNVEPLERWLGAIRLALPDARISTDMETTQLDSVDVIVADAPPRARWDALPKLKLIQSLWMGVDRWLLDTTLPANILVARMLDPSMIAAMTETVLAHVLHAHLNHDEMRRQQAARFWRDHFNPIAAQRSVGVMGLGVLGQAACRALRHIGFNVNAWSRSPKSLANVQVFSGTEERDAFLQASEIVVCLLPLTPATANLIDAQFLSAMRPQSVLINVGRGAHVVEADLLAALDQGHLRHAILDVFQREPLPPEHPFWVHPRVTVTPHSASMANVTTASEFVAENVRRLRAGEALLGVVDRRVGY